MDRDKNLRKRYTEVEAKVRNECRMQRFDPQPVPSLKCPNSELKNGQQNRITKNRFVECLFCAVGY
ncbi:MAG: hypothetical protein ABIL74_08410 [candidate division WOR-3 bacterium]